MSIGKNLKTFLAFFCAIFFGLFCLDSYMKVSWDHRITTMLNAYSFRDGENGKWSPVGGDETSRLSRELEIVKDGEIYLLASDGNQRMRRSIVSSSRISELDFPDGFKWVRLENDSGSIVVEVSKNVYDVWGCHGIRSNWSGNLMAEMILSDGSAVKFRGWAPVYENMIQYYFCKYAPYYP